MVHGILRFTEVHGGSRRFTVYRGTVNPDYTVNINHIFCKSINIYYYYLFYYSIQINLLDNQIEKKYSTQSLQLIEYHKMLLLITFTTF